MSLEMVKSVVTSIILALALVQALGMAQVRGYVRLLPVEKKRLVQWHRLGGAAVLLLALAVAAMCVFGQSSDHQPLPSLPALRSGSGCWGGLVDPGHFHHQRAVVLCPVRLIEHFRIGNCRRNR
jgi:hypothetical protein